LADEVVILSLRNGGYFGLNPVAARVWEMLQEERLVIEIRDMLLREYAVEEEHCTRELVTLLEHFAEWELIELGEEGVAV
jgi:hypothetical protein